MLSYGLTIYKVSRYSGFILKAFRDKIVYMFAGMLSWD